MTLLDEVVGTGDGSNGGGEAEKADTEHCSGCAKEFVRFMVILIFCTQSSSM